MTLYNAVTRYEPHLRHALDEARSHQLAAESLRVGQPAEPVDAESDAWAEVDALRLFSPSVGTAAALVRLGHPVLPVDRNGLTPVSDLRPFLSTVEVVDWWRTHPADGVALVAGPQPSGVTLIGIRVANPRAWRTWLDEHAVDERVHVDDHGRETVERVGRDVGRHSVVRWVPPRAQSSRTVVAMGNAAIQRASHELVSSRVDAAADQPLLLTWAVALTWGVPPTYGAGDEFPVGGVPRRLSVPKARRLGPGVEVVADGTPLLWDVVRLDGWRADATSVPIVPQDPPPSWLLERIGAKWGDWKPAAA